MSARSQSTRSHWAWGLAERYPAPAALPQMARTFGSLLGFRDLQPCAPVPLAKAQVRPSVVTVPAELGWCTTDAADRAAHAHGKGFLDLYRGFRGDFSAAPDVVARPTDEEQIRAVLRWAAAADLVVVPFGGGSSVVGGVEVDPAARRAGVISLDLTGLDQLRRLDPISRLAELDAGMLGPQVEAALRPHGMTLRHYPQSFEFSTLGGWLATRAGGHFATVYTHIDDLTAGMRMLLADGSVWESRPLPGSGAGPSPDRMLLGSEGALGIITRAWMRVRPRPRFKSSATLRFDDFSAGVAAARAVAQAGLYPSNCRLLDAKEAQLNMVDQHAVLLLGFESADRPQIDPMQAAIALAEAAGGRLIRPATHADARSTTRDATAGNWRNAFLTGPYLQSTLMMLGMMVDTFETCCTWAGFPALDAAVRTAVREAMGDTPGRISCRFTHVYPDGPAPYYTWMMPLGGDVADRWRAVKAAASDALLAQGATITHHHAVGRVHRPWYAKQRPAAFGAVLRALKGVCDPAGRLNPGVLIAAAPGD